MIELAILGILDEHEVHGYELKKRMADLAGGPGVSFGSLYPALNRLERAGHVKAIDPTKTRLTSAFTGPMTGALTGELAALRRARQHDASGTKATKAGADTKRSESKRNRKVYGITDSGRARLRELLVTVDPADDRTFALAVAFCRQLPATERLVLFQQRRTHLTSALAQRPLADPTTDPYLRSLHEHDTNTLNADLGWVDELIALTGDELRQPAPVAGVPS